MDIYNMKDYVGGWFIGDFEPSVFNTKDFEVGFKFHKKGDFWDKHYHQFTEEINYLIKGKMKIGDQILKSGDIFHIKKGEISDPTFIEDCELIVVKIPSNPNDKIVIK